MAECNNPNHLGSNKVASTMWVVKNGTMHEGCRSCISAMLTCLFPGTKRTIISKGTGKEYSISPAHVRDIKQRRVAPDLSGMWRDKKGIGSGMRF